MVQTLRLLLEVMLAIGVGFIAWLLRKDTAFRGRMSAAMWIPFLWLLIRGSRPVTAWLGIGGTSDAEGNPIEALITFILFFTAFLILQRRHFRWSRLPFDCSACIRRRSRSARRDSPPSEPLLARR